MFMIMIVQHIMNMLMLPCIFSMYVQMLMRMTVFVGMNQLSMPVLMRMNMHMGMRVLQSYGIPNQEYCAEDHN